MSKSEITDLLADTDFYCILKFFVELSQPESCEVLCFFLSRKNVKYSATELYNLAKLQWVRRHAGLCLLSSREERRKKRRLASFSQERRKGIAMR